MNKFFDTEAKESLKVNTVLNSNTTVVDSSKYLASIPKSVVKDGRIIEVRAGIEKVIGGKKEEFIFIPTEVIGEEVTTIKVTAPTGVKIVMKLYQKDSVETVRKHVESVFSDAQVRTYELSSSFPLKIYSQLNQTLADAGLTPNANLFLRFLQDQV
jgi:hypothetical protein